MKIVSGTIDELLNDSKNILMDITRDTRGNKSSIEKQPVIKPVPAVPAKGTETTAGSTLVLIPKGHGIWRLADIVGERDVITKEREVCYCCKGTDFWIAGTKDDPYKLCRKCRPPVSGAERQPIKQPVNPA
jgi:hypothetical protein